MNVANLSLCKELYELSGWRYTTDQYNPMYNESGQLSLATRVFEGEIPAYDLGYLIRKLPTTTLMQAEAGGSYHFWYCWQTSFTADTPEDAAAKLVIELFKSGVLKREDTER